MAPDIRPFVETTLPPIMVAQATISRLSPLVRLNPSIAAAPLSLPLIAGLAMQANDTLPLLTPVVKLPPIARFPDVMLPIQHGQALQFVVVLGTLSATAQATARLTFILLLAATELVAPFGRLGLPLPPVMNVLIVPTTFRLAIVLFPIPNAVDRLPSAAVMTVPIFSLLLPLALAMRH